VTRITTVLASVLLIASLAHAAWDAPMIDAWAPALSSEGSDTEKPPHAAWAADGDVVVGTGLTRFWGQTLMPGEATSAERVTLAFTVEQSAGRDRQIAGGTARWGFHWGENLPGWDAGVVLRRTDALNFYRVQLSAQRGEIALWDSTGGFLQLIPCELQVGARHELEIVADGAHFVCTLDGERVMDYWDRTLPHATGQTGLAVLESTTRFEDFALETLQPSGEQPPAHAPQFSLATTDGLMWGHPAFGQEAAAGLIVFDGREPILQYRQQGWDPKYKGNRGALFADAVRLRPGWRPEYYTWVGPKINLRVLPLVGELPAAFDVREQGERLVFDFALEEPGVARATETCTISWDADSGVYSYHYDVHTAFTNEEPLDFWYMELTDPLTYNNREPGEDVEHAWNWTEHQWHVFEGPEGDWQRYPLIDYLVPVYNNSPTRWGEVTSFLYPDPAVCPTWKITLGWEPAEGREFRLGLCHWGYDFHQKEEGARIQLPVGHERDYTLALTGTPMPEAEKTFASSEVAPKVRASDGVYATFDPTGTTFEQTSRRDAPTSTMVWEQGVPDDAVGREDSHSLRIDGPGNAMVQVYQYAIEQFADRWWLRGWVKSEDVQGRGLQARIKYSYGPEPEQIFYMGMRGTNGWTPFSFVTDTLTRRDSTTLTFELDGTGQVWLDDVALTALDDDEKPDVTVVEVPPGMEPAEDRVIDLAMTAKPLKAIYDESRHGHALYLDGPEWREEDGRGFLHFDGVDDTATLPIKPILAPLRGMPDDIQQLTVFPLQAFTYEVWVRPEAVPEGVGRMEVLSFRHFPRLWLDAGAPEGELRLVYLNQVYRAEEIKFIETIPIGEWTHVVATHGDGVARLYLNGELKQETAYSTEAMGFEFFAYTWEYHVGHHFAKSNWYAGDIGPIRLYTSALTEEQIKQAYEAAW